MFKDSLITTRLSGPQKPKMDKGTTKIPEYEDDHFDDNESTQSLDSEFGGFDVSIGAKKSLFLENEKSLFVVPPVRRIWFPNSATMTIWRITITL